MKKIIRKRSILFALVLCLTIVFVSSVALAGPVKSAVAPAQALSDVNIAAFTAQNYNYEWKLTPPSYPKSMSAYSFSGPELYMSVFYTGYSSWNLTFIRVNGNHFNHSQLFYAQYPIVSGGVIVGYEILYSIPAAQLSSSNTVTVTSTGTSGGGTYSDLSTNIYFVR